MALQGATVRVLDATGTAIQSGKAVTAAGAYGPIPLSNTGPYRVEACGTVGDKPLCVWGATNNGGALNLTPMSSAVTVLASGKSPETLMTGVVQGLTDDAIASAQAQVRTAIAPALADAGLASDFDLLTGTLTPGNHAGYDRVLDAVSVGFGTDTNAFVTLGSRLGSGTAYLEPGTTQGSIAVDAAATGLDLPGLDGLFNKMNTAMANNSSCQAGLMAVFDANVHASLDPASTAFPTTQAAQIICLRLGGIIGEGETMFGGKLLPTQLGRCDFGSGEPLCRVSFVFQTTKGFQRVLGVEQAAVRHSSGWSFLGNRLEVQATAVARVVRTRRVDSATAPDSYARYLDVSIPAIGTAGGTLQCARVSQKDSSGADSAIALFKKAGGTYLSLWSVSSADATPSLDPASGATRGNDLVSVPVPASAAGDAIVRNFARAGRALKIELFNDSACSTPLGGTDGDALSVELAGLLPLAAVSHSGQPWPALAAASATSLAGLKGGVNVKVNYGPIWTFPRAGMAVNRAQLCTDAACTTKLTELELAGNATAAALSATIGNTPLTEASYKLLRITGRTADGMVLQLDSQSCSTQTAGQPC